MIKTVKYRTRNKRHCKIEFIVTLCSLPGCQYCKFYYNPRRYKENKKKVCDTCLTVKQNIYSNSGVLIVPKKTYVDKSKGTKQKAF